MEHDADRCHKRHKIENSCARLKHWQRVACRCDRCTKVFLKRFEFTLWFNDMWKRFIRLRSCRGRHVLAISPYSRTVVLNLPDRVYFIPFN